VLTGLRVTRTAPSLSWDGAVRSGACAGGAERVPGQPVAPKATARYLSPYEDDELANVSDRYSRPWE